MKIKKNIQRSGMAAIGFALVFGFLGTTQTSAQIKKQILDRMDAHNKGLSSLRSDLTMVKYNSQIDKRDTSTGTTGYLPKSANAGCMCVRIDWKKPLNESIVVIGENYKMYRPSLNQVITGKADKSKNAKGAGNALAFLGMSKAQLMANYEIDYLGEEKINGGTNTWHLLMKPKVATSYKSADLWVDGDGMPRQAMITESNDDTSTILLTNIQKNVDIRKDYFTLNYPKGTKEVKG